MASFLLLPFLLLVFGLCYELVGMFFASNPEDSVYHCFSKASSKHEAHGSTVFLTRELSMDQEYDVALRSKSHIPDITFSGVVSGVGRMMCCI